MSALIDFSVRGNIGVITINNPPVNALSPGVPEGIAESIEKGNAMDEIEAFVLIGGGRTFIAGADIKNMDKGRQPTRVIGGKVLTMRVEANEKPIIAAIHGFALGGGCELALACHIRIASNNAKFGLPEVTLGIIPGYGGTQRLARITGKGRALELILTGDMIDAQRAYEIGLANRVVALEDLLGPVPVNEYTLASATSRWGNNHLPVILVAGRPFC